MDSAGKALYAADEEADSSVVCTGACTSFWIPLTIDAGAPSGNSLPSELASSSVGTARGRSRSTESGSIRSSKTEPGEATGDGFSDAFDGQQFTWHVVSVGDAPDSNQDGGDPGGSFAL